MKEIRIHIICSLLFFTLNFVAVAQYEINHKVSVLPHKIIPNSTVNIFYKSRNKHNDLKVRFGFNGWTLKNEVNSNYYFEETMKWNNNLNSYQGAVHIPEKARSIHFSFCWNNCNDWDNNRRKDYKWPIYFPYIGPILTKGNKTNSITDIIVSFYNTFKSKAWINLCELNNKELIDCVHKVNSRSKVHRFPLENLKYNTAYSYQVGIGKIIKSQRYTFRTPKKDLKSIRFIVIGDMQDDGLNGNLSIIANELVKKHQDVDFIISTGDCAANDKDGFWWTFFDKMRLVLSSKIFMPTIGNHDTPTNDSSSNHKSFFKYFALPNANQSRPFYKFNFGSLSFFALNSERTNDFKNLTADKHGRQYRWIKKELYSNPEHGLPSSNIKWAFAYWHKPPFNIGHRHWKSQFSYRDITRLFPSKIDWVFNGHEHSYQRSRPILFDEDGNVTTGKKYGNNTIQNHGVGHLIVPSSGARSHKYFVQKRSLLKLFAYPKKKHLAEIINPINHEGKVLQGSWNLLKNNYQIGFSKVTIKNNFIKITTYGGYQINHHKWTFQKLDTISYKK